MRTRGLATLYWLLAIAPLHDALLEDLLDNAAHQVGAEPAVAPWTASVRTLRAILRRRGPRGARPITP